MLRLINNLRLQGLRSCSGQVAVIMIVIIAIGLVLFAASINLGMLAQSKTISMKAANASASVMASMIASHGEREYIETLGRTLQKCKTSGGGFFGFLTFIFMILVAVFAPEILSFLQAPASMVPALQAAATVGAVMEGAALIIAASIDPGISDMWNKRAQDLSQTGQAVERGIQAGLQAAVTDQVKMPDLYDLDQDGLYGYPGNDETQPPNDVIGRFSLYNTKRFLEVKGADTSAVQAFLAALHELVLKGTDNWGLWDPVYYPDFQTKNPLTSASHACFYSPSDLTNFPKRPAECDYCCQSFGGGALPPECDGTPGVPQVGNPATCANRTPYRAVGNVYQYVYDPTYEDSTNIFMSFREQLGRDDEHHLYHTTPANPNWHSDTLNGAATLNTGVADQGFFLKDTVGYYTLPAAASNLDLWVGVQPLGTNPPTMPKLFPFLYKMQDWGPQLSSQTYNDYECHWCDSRKPAEPGRTCPADMATYPEISRLVLPFDPALVPYNIAQGWCVNKTNKGGTNDPPVVSDNVIGTPSLIVPVDQCAVSLNPSPLSDLTQYVKGWKRGADRYCKDTPGYDVDCPKSGALALNENNAQCGEAGTQAPANWPDDMIDEIIYGLPSLFGMEATFQQTITTGVGLQALAKELVTWYPEVAEWIEPPCSDPDNCPGSFTKLERPGTLWIWRAQLQFLYDAIQSWLLPNAANAYNGPSHVGSDAVWCVPSFTAGNGFSPPGEIATFDVNNNTIRGDVEDVVACLKWNAQDVRTYTGPVASATGNAEKFQRCHDSCSFDTCSNLPRSLVPDFYDGTKYLSGQPANAFNAGNAADAAALSTCLTSATINACSTNCDSPPLPSGSPYNLPLFQSPDSPSITTIDNWCAGPNSATPLNNACNGALMPGGVTTLDCATNRNDCRCSWAGSCAGGFAGCNLGLPTYFNAVTDALTLTGRSCDDPAYITVMQQSATEAQIQVEKFKHRVKFLEGRYNEAVSVSAVLRTAIDKLTEFLDGGTPFETIDSPAESFIDARMQHMDNISGDLPSHAIYVWQDEDAVKTNPGGLPRWGTGRGYWHAVKVEVRLPRRCTGDCIAGDWPKVVSTTKKSGGFISRKVKVCYTLHNLVGRTKARVIRYDQDKDLRGLIFPSGQQIWQSRLSNPSAINDPDPTGLRQTCADFIDADLKTWLAGTDERSHIGAAFMLNAIPNLTLVGNNYTDCWNKVHQDLLAHGVQSESCAEYYFATNGFRIRFVPCDDW
ncbi:MAG: hypothetical protein H6754_02965 [Candidatus Omnitrophica bacterium]|nr:hypothetical protein [Candidatus Omnitrophota bacterium]